MSYVSLAIISTFLVLYGNEINDVVKKQIRHLHFIARVGIYILVCTFAYGMMTVVMHELLIAGLKSLDNIVKLPLIILTFVLIGIVAERKRHI